MKCLQLKLLGGFEARAASGDLIALPNRKAQALLAYLALHPDTPHSREKLAGLLRGLLERTEDAAERRALRLRIADLSASVLGDPTGAYAALASAFLADPTECDLPDLLWGVSEQALQ